MPAPFNLASGQTLPFTLCTDSANLCSSLHFSVTVVGQVMADGSHCGIYDSTSTNLIAVTSYCSGTVSNTATVSGNVYVHCDGTTGIAVSDSPMAGVTVTLLNASSVQIASTTTDINGHYVFLNLVAGNYTIQVTPPPITPRLSPMAAAAARFKSPWPVAIL